MVFKEIVAAVTYNLEKEKFSDKWEFPSGKIEEGETVEGPAIIELREKLSIQGKVIKDVGRFELEQQKLEIHPVLVKTVEDKVEISKEHKESRWVAKDEIKEFDTVPNVLNNFEALGIT